MSFWPTPDPLVIYPLFYFAHMGIYIYELDIIYVSPIWAILKKMSTDKKGGRPKCMRKVEAPPEVDFFKPRGIPLTELDSVNLSVEEVEAIKLVHYDRLMREDAAEKMGVSRRTLERELKAGLGKVADALLNGKAIEIKGGHYLAGDENVFRCLEDKHEWKVKKSFKRPKECPGCGSTKIKKVNENEGFDTM